MENNIENYETKIYKEALEKAKAYDKAMDRAKKELDFCGSQDCDAARQIFILFPELKEKEDEDERIRKGLINYFNNFSLPTFGGLDPKKILAWLEKQKDMKAKLIISDEGYNKAFQDGIEEVLTNPHKYGLEKQGNISPTEDELEALRIAAYEPIKNWSEKLQSLYEKLVYCEYKPADKVEPKFHVNEWVVTDKNDVVQIKAVNNGYYTIDNGMDFNMPYVDRYWHKWTIQDAKDGDVLKEDSCIFILKK